MIHNSKLIIYTDGGARGNPGPAAIGIIVDGEGFREYIGETTNNVAVYKAVIFALKKSLELLGEKSRKTILEINLDSELIANQLKGDYRVKHENLKPLFLECLNLMKNFKKTLFNIIPREKNTEADKLVNQELDLRR